MHQCIYNSENPQCPFLEYRTQDYFQQYQTLNKLSDSAGQQMLKACGLCRHQCKTIKVPATILSRNWDKDILEIRV